MMQPEDTVGDSEPDMEPMTANSPNAEPAMMEKIFGDPQHNLTRPLNQRKYGMQNTAEALRLLGAGTKYGSGE